VSAITGIAEIMEAEEIANETANCPAIARKRLARLAVTVHRDCFIALLRVRLQGVRL
jgi:hypothetical protein